MKIEEKTVLVISGFDLRTNNRGTAALSYGAFSFLKEKALLKNNDVVVKFRYVNNPFKSVFSKLKKEKLCVQGLNLDYIVLTVNRIQKSIFEKTGVKIPFTNFSKYWKKVDYVAAINGGDGFSDIYGSETFMKRLSDISMAIKLKKKLFFLPQTIGPFSLEKNRNIAEQILKQTTSIYVRDDKFVNELKNMNLKYEITKDLSYYMMPMPFSFSFVPNSVGINVSGLAYSNKFRDLSGQFENYPYLIDNLISAFQQKNIPVYLIPHSYNVKIPEYGGDDLIACQEVFAKHKNKKGLYVVEEDLISPQIKYVISQMSYFIGTRMHANFAAIYTNVPVYGLAYSYKFEGAFKYNGVFHDNISMINNVSKEESDAIVDKIIADYLVNHIEKKL